MDEWLKNRVAALKALKSVSDQQALLILLAENPERTAKDNKKLEALVRAEKAALRAAKARQAAAHLIQSEQRAKRLAERKARNHRLILQGTLIDLAGLQDRSPGEILGLLLAAANTEDPQKWAHWKVRGDALLAEKSEKIEAAD